MALAAKEFHDTLRKIKQFSRAELLDEYNTIEIETARTKEILSSASKALAKLRARKLAVETRLNRKVA